VLPSLSERLEHAEKCLLDVGLPEDAEAVMRGRAALAEAEKERDDSCTERAELRAALDAVRAERDAAIQRAEVAERDAAVQAGLSRTHEAAAAAARAQLAEALAELEAFEDAVRENLPEVTCDADGNLECNEINRIETVGLLYREIERDRADFARAVVWLWGRGPTGAGHQVTMDDVNRLQPIVDRARRIVEAAEKGPTT
jgi:hypothetical protein